MPRVIEEGVGPIPLLADYSSEFAGVVGPWGGGFDGEPADPAERRVLWAGAGAGVRGW